MAAFAKPWSTCNNCKQPFQGQLTVDLASAFVSFAEATYGHPNNNKMDRMKVMAALRTNIIALLMSNDYSNEVANEKRRIIDNLLSMIDQTKKDFNMSRWIHMPKDSDEYQYYDLLLGDYEAYAYEELGGVSVRDISKKGKMIAITHLKKARAIYKLVDMKDRVQQIDTKISMVINAVVIDGEAAHPTMCAYTSSVLQDMKNIYENIIHESNLIAPDIYLIRRGLNYANALWNTGNLIEAERVVAKLVAVSRRVHGPKHNITIEADELLENFKERRVCVCVYIYPAKMFQALRYENDGEICVLQGPIADPRSKDNEEIHHVESNLVVPVKGCAVICHGLVSASHLNGELGEVRNIKRNGTEIRLAVHFEKKSLKSAWVKPANLRIVIELPTKD
jgi:hypothetical protein